MSTTLKEFFRSQDCYKMKIYIDNDIVFTRDGKELLEMNPEDALIEALEMLGLQPEKV